LCLLGAAVALMLELVGTRSGAQGALALSQAEPVNENPVGVSSIELFFDLVFVFGRSGRLLI
jgi:hypothetical protein